MMVELGQIINKNKAVMIDGPWGCGKTYEIKRFIDSNRKYRYIYISLFGLNSYNDLVNTLYCKVHPFKFYFRIATKFAVNTLSSLSIGAKSEDVSAKLGFILDIPGVKKGFSEPYNKTIIFLDDLERVDFDKISMLDILGVVENLIYQQYKVVLVCNTKEIKNKELESLSNFKEKVIDKQITIRKIDENIIYDMFVEKAVNISKIFDDIQLNIRLAKRVKHLFNEITELIKDRNTNHNYLYTNQDIFDTCVDVIVGFYTNAYYNKYVERKEKSENELDFEVVFACLDDVDDEDKIGERINAISYTQGYAFNTKRIDLLKGIINYEMYGITDTLIELFKNEKSILDENYILYTDEELQELLKKQIIYILNSKKFPDKTISTLEYFFTYGEKEVIDSYKEDITDYLIKNKDEFKKQLNNSHFLRYTLQNTNNYSSYIKEVMNTMSNKDCIDKMSQIISCYKNMNYVETEREIRELLHIVGENENLLTRVGDEFKKNNYLLDYIDKHLPNDEYWKMLHTCIGLYERIGIFEEVKDYAESLQNSNKNNALSRRINFLFYK